MHILKNILRQSSILILLLVFAIGCTGPSGKSGKVTISGKFSQFPGKTVTLSEVDTYITYPIDTATIAENGDFRFRFAPDSATIFLLKIDNRNYLTLVLDEEKNVKVYSDNTSIRDGYRVEGSEVSQALAEYELVLERNKKKVDSLIFIFNQSTTSSGLSTAKKQTEPEYEEIFAAQKKLTMQFIDEYCSSMASLLVLNRRFGQRKLLTEENDANYYLKVDTCLSAKYPNTRHILEHKKKVETILQKQAIKAHRDNLLAIGRKAPDITLEDPDGKSIPLYSLEGKKVLVYFWASWDKDSRKANKEMKRIYDMFHPQGLEVYAIGLESYRETWTGAIKADGLNWINVTDYLNIQSGAAGLFNFPKSFPYFFLLDENLTIQYKGSSMNELITLLRN